MHNAKSALPNDKIMADLFAISNAVIDEGKTIAEIGPINRVACHLVEPAARAEPGHNGAHAIRAEVYQKRRESETPLVARTKFGDAADESSAQIEKE